MTMKNRTRNILRNSLFLLTASAFALSYAKAAEEGEQPVISKDATLVPHDASVFAPDPSYEKKPYDPKAQLEIYGGKQAYEVHRPLLELGDPMYSTGLISKSSNIFGRKNPTASQFLVYGDLRTIASYVEQDVDDQTQFAAQLNLDFDWKLTATERIHIFIKPLDNRNGDLTRYEYNKDETGERQGEFVSEFDAEPDALFFEGDLGAITAGISGEYVSWDLPFSLGLMPLLFQNGIWLDDAFTGLSFAIPAMHSTALDISNMDISFFFGFDKVTSGLDVAKESDLNLYGVTAFIEANRGYWEMGYAFIDDRSELADQSYHNATISFTKRYGAWLSNSMRVITNFGQERNSNANTDLQKTADGTLLILENSLITSKPSTFIPYFNLFYGIDRPQSVARGVDKGGILKNTGITFDGGAAKIPTMDATANNTAGIAIGLENLFALNQQLVFEVAYLADIDDDNDPNAVGGDQYGVGLRYQKPLNKAWIFRADANYIQTDTKPESDQRSGVALEIRRKF